MQAFESLSLRGQLGRLRHMAESAVKAYGLERTRIVPLAHRENTTFRVETSGPERYVLRIHRMTGTPFHPPRSVAEVRSEMIWISALRREAGLAVPEPMPTVDGSLLTVAEVDGVPEPRVCVLLRWGPGRFLDAHLTPAHLERVGGFMARLHDHALRFAPPPDFARGLIGDVSGEVGTYVARSVREACGQQAASIVEFAMETVRDARRALGAGSDVFGLIHADLHQENYLFDRGQVRAIDFDDSGWGHLAYDLAVPLSELRRRPDYGALRAGLLRGYRAVRPFPVEHERYLEVFRGLRLIQLTLWFLEQRDHPAFTDGDAEVRQGLLELETLIGELGSFA